MKHALKNARKCDGCRALRPSLFSARCELGYAVDGVSWKAVPAERCPKPTTYAAFVSLCLMRNAVGGRPVGDEK